MYKQTREGITPTCPYRRCGKIEHNPTRPFGDVYWQTGYIIKKGHDLAEQGNFCPRCYTPGTNWNQSTYGIQLVIGHHCWYHDQPPNCANARREYPLIRPSTSSASKSIQNSSFQSTANTNAGSILLCRIYGIHLFEGHVVEVVALHTTRLSSSTRGLSPVRCTLQRLKAMAAAG